MIDRIRVAIRLPLHHLQDKARFVKNHDFSYPLSTYQPPPGQISRHYFCSVFFTTEPGPWSIRCGIDILQLEGHSVERIYVQQRSSDGSVNKTILEPRLVLAARRQYVYVGFSRRKIPRSSAARWKPRQGV